jgi:hypothetical protein
MTSLCVDRIPDRRRSNDGSQRSNERGHFCGRFRQRPQHIDSTRFTTCVNLCRQKTSQRETRRRHSLRIYQQRYRPSHGGVHGLQSPRITSASNRPPPPGNAMVGSIIGAKLPRTRRALHAGRWLDPLSPATSSA